MLKPRKPLESAKPDDGPYLPRSAIRQKIASVARKALWPTFPPTEAVAMSRRSANRRGPSQARKPDRDGPAKLEAPPAPPAAPNPDLEASRAAIGAPLREHEQARRAAVLAMPKPPSDDGLTQSERFIKAARELETDDDPERFKERVRKLAKLPVPPTRDD